MDDLVSTAWLAEHLRESDLAVVDATTFMPSSGRDARDGICRGPHSRRALPRHRRAVRPRRTDSAHASARRPVRRRDGASSASAATTASSSTTTARCGPPRAAGSCSAIMARNGSRSSTAGSPNGATKAARSKAANPKPRDARFEASSRPGEVVAKSDIRAGLGVPLVDARGRARFEGSEPDPRAGVAPGHIPGARNLPFASLYNDDGTFKREEELREAFVAAGVDPERPFVASCGSGVTANQSDLRRAAARQPRHAAL